MTSSTLRPTGQLLPRRFNRRRPNHKRDLQLENLEQRELMSVTALDLGFGPNISQVAVGYAQMPLSNAATRSQGWESTVDPQTLNRHPGDAPKRDGHLGTYDVTARLGNFRSAFDNGALRVEEQPVADATDGQSEIGLDDGVAANPYFSLDALNVSAKIDEAANFQTSYEFAEDGVFEIVASSSPTAQVDVAPPMIELETYFWGTVGEAITFEPVLRDPSTGDVAAGSIYRWYFGDGSDSWEATPSHVYEAEGTYTLLLVVFDQDFHGAWTTSIVTIGGGELSPELPPELPPALPPELPPVLPPPGGGWVSQPAAPVPEGLIGAEHMQYVGSFSLPQQFGPYGQTFAYGGTAPAYNPAHHSLFVVGHTGEQLVAEVKIPDVLDGSQAVLLQWFGDVTDGLRDQFRESVPSSESVLIGGLLVDGDRLIGTLYEYYDAGYGARTSHFVSGSLDLSISGDAYGIYSLGPLNPGFYAGYMAHVPEPWIERLGFSYVTGQANISILGRTSIGPSLHGFDPNSFGEAVPLVYYPPFTNPTIGGWESTVVPGDPLQSINGTARIMGVVMVGDVTLFFGVQAPGDFLYGTGGGWYGPYQPDGIYLPTVWAYRNEDFERVVHGEMQPWAVVPYAVWNFDVPSASIPAVHHLTALSVVLGATFDPQTNRIYVTSAGSDATRPQVHVYELVF